MAAEVRTGVGLSNLKNLADWEPDSKSFETGEESEPEKVTPATSGVKRLDAAKKLPTRLDLCISVEHDPVSGS